MWILTDDNIFRLDNYDRVYFDGTYTWVSRTGTAPMAIARGNVIVTIQNAIRQQLSWLEL